MTDTHHQITATVVQEDDKMDFLPRHFTMKFMILGEQTVYNWMRRLSSDYNGGVWDFVELSNGGFFMVPKREKPWNVVVPGNHFSEQLSAEATGIVVMLFVLENLYNVLGDKHDVDFLYEKLYQLKDYAREHAESSLIFRAID